MNLNNLYPYQREAYEAVVNHFNSGEQRACIVHATGLGKSYVIAAVAEHFQNILIVAPNNYVIAQVQSKVDREDVDYTTYTQLMFDAKSKKIVQGKYNLIVFDEFHRTGAKRWAEGVKYVMKQNAEAKIFGTSATPIRYLDNGRNMAEELFNGHVMDTINVTDAWVRGILVPPVYVISLDSFSQVKEDYLQKINSEYVPGEARPEMLQQLETAQQAWDKLGGVSGVIRNNISPKTKRVIVFCPNIEKIEEDRAAIVQWFREAGIHIYKTYIIDSSRGQKSNEDEMAYFQQDGYQGVKIMISINMLNEGIHIPRVDAIVMLRRTVSMNIYLQQMGRCMAATDENHPRPVILDLQNNIANVGQNDSFLRIEQEYKESVRKNNYSGEDRFMTIKGMELNIISTLQTIDEKFKYCYNNFDWYNNYEELSCFFNENGFFPKYKDNKRLYEWARNWWRSSYLKNPEMYQEKAQLLADIGFEYKSFDEWADDVFMKNYEEAKVFFEEHGHFPTYRDNRRLNSWARNWWRKTAVQQPEKANLLNSLGFCHKSKENWRREIWVKNYEECNAFYHEHGHFPTYRDNLRLNSWASNWWRNNYLMNPELYQEEADMLIAIGYVHQSANEVWNGKFMKNYEEAKAFFEEHGHFPNDKEDKEIRLWAMNWWRDNYLKNPQLNQEKADMLIAIGFEYLSRDKYLNRSWFDCYEEAKTFFEVHGHFPTQKDSRRLNSWARNWWKNTYLKNGVLHQNKADMLLAIGFEYKGKKQ